jgi:hypothetical protein
MPLMMIGTPARPGMTNETPSLADAVNDVPIRIASASAVRMQGTPSIAASF